MSGSGTSDASTSTDADAQARPLCLFYFTQPFGVLSPEPPTLAAAPAHIARAFLNMQPVSPFYWAGAAAGGDSFRSATSSTLSFEMGGARGVPVRVLGVRRPAAPLSSLSSLAAPEAWAPPSPERGGRRLRPGRTLPPLRLPSPRAAPSPRRREDAWAARARCSHAGKVSLPPISRPAAGARATPAPEAAGSGARSARARRPLGVHKQLRRRRGPDVRRMVACLMRRAINGADGAESPAPALRRALRTVRAAWPAPAPAPPAPRRHSRAVSPPSPSAGMQPPLSPPGAPRPRAPPPARRRYSVPETIMRKYRLAQLQSDSSESGAGAGALSAGPSPRDACSPPDSPHRFLRRDRELMRKSALLRRMWTRAPACCCCEEARATRSLDGSHSELRAPAARARRAPADLSSYVETATDAFSDSDNSRCGYASESREDRPSDSCERSALLTTTTATTAPFTADTAERSQPDAVARRDSYTDSDSFSVSVSTAKETTGSTEVAPQDTASSSGRVEGGGGRRSAGDDTSERDMVRYEPAQAPSYDLLEIVVSETSDASPAPATGRLAQSPPSPFAVRERWHHVNIDEYVSNILVESLNSLSDQLESMSASICSDKKISIVEKEIKVKLQNAGVNTIVHLSPTSNNQIIFGNEELCNERRARDECNNPLSIRDERPLGVESDDNPTLSPGSPRAPFDPPLQHDNNVNRAVLQQIQKLFRDELHELSNEPPGVTRVEISDVDVYVAGPDAVVDDGELIGGVGAGNYFRDGNDAVAVPRFSAYPHTESMEVNTSSSEDAEPPCSDCASLVDSLDDPASPRGALLRRRAAPHRLEAASARAGGARAAPDSRGEAFFVRIEDGDAAAADAVRVAEYMPEKIKQRLYRRHRKRELRMECARRSKVKQLKKELERRRLEELARARRELERDCAAIVAALIDDVIAKVAQDEYRGIRARNRSDRLAKSEENLVKRGRRRDAGGPPDAGTQRRPSEKESRRSERHQIHGKLVARPSLATSDRPPRRIYQKSEIHEGEKCIEILEILEYVNGSQSSPETTNSDDNHANSKCKMSRIPIPIYERIQTTSRSDVQMRLMGGEARRSPPAGGPLADALLRALGEPRAPAEPRSRSNSLRFKRVFDIIPEERSSLSFDSSEDAEFARRASAPEVVAPLPAAQPSPPPPRPAPPSTRSAGTSPLAAGEEPARLRSQTTMTSPCSRSAATSPLRPSPARPEPPRAARAGWKEEVRESVENVEKKVSTPPRDDGCRPPSAGGAWRGAGGRARVGCSSSSSSGESGGSLLCSLAPRWLAGQARSRRRARRAPAPAPTPAHHPPHATARIDPGPESERRSAGGAGAGPDSGGWSVTVAGSCRAALPADVEMRLRFPHEPRAPSTAAPPTPAAYQECRCVQCAACAGGRAALPPPPPAHPAPPTLAPDSTLTLTMKKEEQDSSILASKSSRKSSEQLPELETYRASRTKLKSSVKTRRGYSLHCWLPDDAPAPIRVNNGLSVLGCAIIPELKPRVPTMSERDLTRIYTPRHYLRS